MNAQAIVRCALFLVVMARCASADLPASVTLAEKYPPRVEDVRPTAGWAPQFQRASVPAVREQAPLLVDWGSNDLASAEVTFGVPFPRGALPDIARARIVADDGAAAPADFKVASTWDGPQGPVRWALATAHLRRDRQYILEYGSAVQPTATAAIQLSEDADGITIDTGPLRARISRHHPTLLETVWLADADGGFVEEDPLIDPARSRSLLPMVVDDRERVFPAGGAAEGLKVEIVEAGARRVAVRREGWYVNSSGERFCQFIAYTYFYAGQAELAHDHTLVVAFDSNKHRIRDIQIPLPLVLDEDAVAVFATDGSPAGDIVELPAGRGTWSLLQKQHDQWALSGPEGVLQAGERAGGWFGLRDAQRGVWAGLTDFWQQAPAELEVDGDILRLHLWPARGVPFLDLRPSAQLGAAYPGKHRFHNRWYVKGLDEMTQAYGLAKTHNLRLRFFDAPKREAARRQVRMRCVEPVLALPDPAYICGSGVMHGRLHPYDPERFPEVEALVDSVVDFYYSQRETAGQYGWIHFGDVYNTGNLWRRWAAMFYGFPNVMPRLYLRSGRRAVWDFHRVNTRHVMDIDMCHLDHDEFGKWRGGRYGGDGGIAHYAADIYTMGPDHHVEFMFQDYYINGNLRALEVARAMLRAHADRRDDRNMTEYRHRGTGGALRFFSVGYQATWDPEYLGIMRQVADVLYEAQERLGVIRHDDVYMNQGLILYYQLTGEERMRELFLDNMRTLSRRRNIYVNSHAGRGSTFSGLAHAYWFTGDESFLPFLLWQLELAQAGGLSGLRGNRLAINATHGSTLPEAMAILAAVDPLPAAAGPAILEPQAQPLALSSNWAFYLLQETDAAFSVTLAVDLYSQAGSFPNWREWVAQLEGPEQPELLVIDPDGVEIRRMTLTSESTQKPFKIELSADGKTGVYTIVPANPVTPLSLRLVDSTLDRRMAHAGENWTALQRARTYFFTVPAGTGRFGLRFKAARVRNWTRYGVRNAEGDLLAENEWQVSASPRNQWEGMEFDAGQPETNEVWSITFQFPTHQAQGPTWLQFDGIPGYVASAPDELFLPDPAVRREMPMVAEAAGTAAVEIVPGGLPWGGKAARLNRNLTLSAPEAGQFLMHPPCGTLELWLRPTDPHSDLDDRRLLQCGSFSLLRRYNIGTYAMIGGRRFHRFFVLPTDRWTHLAFTWQASDEANADLEIRLFADGVEVKSNDIGSSGTPHKRVPDDWPGKELVLYGGVLVSNLRISDTVRYRQNFTRPAAPFTPDEQTRLLSIFDGD